MNPPVVHRFQASLFPVNAYLIELADGVVVVDATIGVSDGLDLRARVEATGKPLISVVVTHAHPDHYGGLTSLVADRAVPIVATDGVDRIIRRDDAAKEKILRPMFGDEWAPRRTFPNQIVRNDERLPLGDASLRVVDLGPGESPHDSLWLLESAHGVQAFVGDLVYNAMHAYLADGFAAEWLTTIARVRRDLAPDTVFHMGHGASATAGPLLDRQETYIRTFVDAVRTAADESAGDDDQLVAAVTARMKEHLPTDDLLFLMQLSVLPMRDALRHNTGGGL